MAVTVLAGIRSTGNVNTSQQVRDVAEAISYLDPDKTPFTRLQLAMGAKRSVKNPKFEMLEKRRPPDTDTISVTLNSTTNSTQVTPTQISYYKAGDLVRNLSTGEVILVTAVNTSTLTVTRAIGGSATTWNAGHSVLIIGNAFAEGSANPNVISAEVDIPYNYIQILRRNWKVTNTELLTQLYGADELTERNRENALEHALDIEKTLLFGNRDISGSSGSAPLRFTGGLLWFLDQASIGSALSTAIGSLAWDDVTSWAKNLFAHNGDDKVAFCGNTALKAISDLAYNKGTLNMTPETTEFGIKVFKLVTPFGNIGLVPHRAMNITTFSGYVIAITPANVKLAYQGEMTKVLEDVGTPGTDAKESGLLSRVGLHLVLPETHGYMSGITGAAS